ncbi:MAG: hypothetical protein PVH77_03365 [Phycisphaerales bacterium]
MNEFESPWPKAHFNIGNVTLFGYSQSWPAVLTAFSQCSNTTLNRDNQPANKKGSCSAWGDYRTGTAKLTA